MLPRPEDQFHVGIVVDDFERARAWFTDTLGYGWGHDLQLEYTMLVPGGQVTYQQRVQYSITEPRFELVQAVEGTPLQPSSSGLHHFGYWCDDVAGTSEELAASGWAWECGGLNPDGSPAWAYHFNPLGVRVELVSSGLRDLLSAMWTPRDG
jgi:catechol 2,3-dioxygenase-like lactoylglutathione lyase family enzyme